MEINKDAIRELLPEKFKKRCLIGICDPKYLDGSKPVYSLKNKKWSATPREIFPAVKSIIVLIHLTPVANDYRVEEIIVELGSLSWKEFGLKTHIINESGKVCPDMLVGTEWGPSSKKYDKLILLKELAYYAGLGRYGKSSLIINSHFGSDFKIQALFTEEKIKYDYPLIPRKYPECKNCNLCIELCPGDALSNYKIEQLKCQWNWNRDFRGIPRPYLLPIMQLRKPNVRNYLFDDRSCRNCQAFCKANSDHYIKL